MRMYSVTNKTDEDLRLTDGTGDSVSVPPNSKMNVDARLSNSAKAYR